MMNEYNPDYISPPGETINEILKFYEMDKKQFAEMMDLEDDEVEKLLKGDVEIDCDLATRLQVVVGVTVEFWLEREKQYREGLIRNKDNG